MSGIKPFVEIAETLGEAITAWETLARYIRTNYVMDELWTDGKTTGKLAAYRDELKFRRGGKTLVTVYIRDGFFKVCIVFGKDERVKFEEAGAGFSEAIRKLYDETHTYHDGKWLGIDVYDTSPVDDIIKLLNIKRKPNRKASKTETQVSGETVYDPGKCDLGLSADDVTRIVTAVAI